VKSHENTDLTEIVNLMLGYRAI